LPLQGAAILQVIPHLGAGGAERTTIEVAEALKAAGAIPIVASVGGRLEGELGRVGGELIRIDSLATKNPMQIWLNAGVIAKIARERNVKLIHARSRAPGWSAYWAAKRMKLPFVTTYHGVYNAKSGIKRWYNSVMVRGDRVIANSDYTAKHVIAEHPQAASRIVTIHRGVDIARFSPEAVNDGRRASLRKAWRLDEQAGAVILLPARMTGWKGHREAIAAAGMLAKQQPALPWSMVFVGDHQGRLDYVAELSDLISQHGVDARVRMAGHCDDMPAALALSDIVIAPSSEPEAFGRVAAEAGAMGVPAVGSAIGAQGEIIVDGETGLIVPPRDPAALAGAMGQLLAMGKAHRSEMGGRAMARIRDRFTTSALQKATLSVYEGLMDRSK
jgi:glycosyltransferase involved in cell wall biosynthesis